MEAAAVMRWKFSNEFLFQHPQVRPDADVLALQPRHAANLRRNCRFASFRPERRFQASLLLPRRAGVVSGGYCFVWRAYIVVARASPCSSQIARRDGTLQEKPARSVFFCILLHCSSALYIEFAEFFSMTR